MTNGSVANLEAIIVTFGWLAIFDLVFQVSARVSSRMVAADARRRISARKTIPPRYLGGYGSCDDS